MFKHIRKLCQFIADWILHKSYFQTHPGEVHFYDVSEDKVPLDGVVVVYDQLFREERAYGFHFEDRYVTRLSQREQTLRVISACNLQSQIRPMFVLRGNRADTAYGELHNLPERICALLRSYSLPIPQ